MRLFGIDEFERKGAAIAVPFTGIDSSNSNINPPKLTINKQITRTHIRFIIKPALILEKIIINVVIELIADRKI